MIQEYENLLRTIIINELGFSDDTDYKVSEDRCHKWHEKRELESKKYKGILLEKRIIYYSDFYDLKTIISKNWDTNFKDVFFDKKKFIVLFEIMENFRNTISHGREVLSFQEFLIKGIIGETKSQLLIYHNRKMNVKDYFINILSVTDSLGTDFEDITNFKNPTILRVGDEIEFKVEAFDPKDRKIQYYIDVKTSDKLERFESDTGVFKIVITKQMISKDKTFLFIARTLNTDYENESIKGGTYCILP